MKEEYVLLFCPLHAQNKDTLPVILVNAEKKEHKESMEAACVQHEFSHREQMVMEAKDHMVNNVQFVCFVWYNRKMPRPPEDTPRGAYVFSLPSLYRSHYAIIPSPSSSSSSPLLCHRFDWLH